MTVNMTAKNKYGEGILYKKERAAVYTFDVTGRGKVSVENIVFDYNGTIAEDGKLMENVRILLPLLAQRAKIYIVSADTYGTVKEECKDLPVEVKTFAVEHAAECKEAIAIDLQKAGGVACLGNGINDIKMCKAADISIAVVNHETMSAELLRHVDIFAPSARAGVELFLRRGRLESTLRK